ncbi:MAG TPA: ABC transporter permease subunit [Acholeplasma sp.]|nr:ABC transporter permease subunit [Acholeplasma sp.]
MTKTNRKYLYYSLGILFVILVWFIGSIIVNSEIVLPKISLVLKTIGELFTKGETYLIILRTFLDILLVTFLTLILALIFAILALKFEGFKYFFSPIVTLLKSIPVVAVIILFLLMVGQTFTPYIITFLVIFPILYEGIYSSIDSIDKYIVDDVKTISNLNYLVVKDIYYPLSIPKILVSLLQSFGLGFKVIVMAQMIAQTKGTIGYQIGIQNTYLETKGVFAWTIILIVLVLIIDSVLHLVLKKVKNKIY